MPSGAKKRKAASRKKEIVHGAHPVREGAQGSGSSGEEEAAVTPMDSSNGAGDHQTDASSPGLVEEKETAALEACEVSVELIKGESAAAPDPASEEAQQVSVELIQAVKSEAVVLAEAPREETEEVVEVAEAAANTVEDSSGVESSMAPETEERSVPASSNYVSKEQRDISEPCQESEVLATEQRASWRNCCGLLDLLARSWGNIRFDGHHKL